MRLATLFLALFAFMQGQELVWDKLTEAQKQVAREVYSLGKPYNLGATLVSIAWQESRLGGYPINLQDPSCGVMHINVKTYLGLHKLKDTPYNRNWYCSRLINDVKLNVATAIEVLLWFKAYHKGSYNKMVKSYNAGFNTHLAQADNYYKQVYHNVKIVENLKGELE